MGVTIPITCYPERVVFRAVFRDFSIDGDPGLYRVVDDMIMRHDGGDPGDEQSPAAPPYDTVILT